MRKVAEAETDADRREKKAQFNGKMAPDDFAIVMLPDGESEQGKCWEVQK